MCLVKSEKCLQNCYIYGSPTVLFSGTVQLTILFVYRRLLDHFLDWLHLQTSLARYFTLSLDGPTFQILMFRYKQLLFVSASEIVLIVYILGLARVLVHLAVGLSVILLTLEVN